MLYTLVVLTASVVTANLSSPDGLIEGVVVRATDHWPVAGARVVLRSTVDGQWIPVAEKTADAQGRFRFDHLPADGTVVYLPGANHDGIHFPGTRVRLSPLQRRAEVELAVYDTIAFPNPLVVPRHMITLCPEPGVLRVTESMLIDNPGQACYVGQAAPDGAQAVTLRLAIPANFEQVTFASEFFGRRFALVDGKLVTGVPWPPGRRELTFSYTVAIAERHSIWQRSLDLPSANVRVAIRVDQPEQITCNLRRAPPDHEGNAVFESDEQTLSAGHLLRVELGDLSLGPMAYAPWAAVATLGCLILVSSMLIVSYGKRTGGLRENYVASKP